MNKNLSINERIEELLKLKCENKNLDYKEACSWNSSKEVKGEIIKDILAMANTQDGGTIIFGIRDSDFKFVGLSEDDYKSFDQTKVNYFLHKYTDPKHTCYINKYIIDEMFIK